jgi:DNA-binding transcriptional MerR regulator
MSQLRIGDLARLGGVSVRMLRHYHEIGLLVPAAIDGQTGYRYYDQDQVEVLAPERPTRPGSPSPT